MLSSEGGLTRINDISVRAPITDARSSRCRSFYAQSLEGGAADGADWSRAQPFQTICSTTRRALPPPTAYTVGPDHSLWTDPADTRAQAPAQYFLMYLRFSPCPLVWTFTMMPGNTTCARSKSMKITLDRLQMQRMGVWVTPVPAAQCLCVSPDQPCARFGNPLQQLLWPEPTGPWGSSRRVSSEGAAACREGDQTTQPSHNARFLKNGFHRLQLHTQARALS